jgi:hypothetical protein
VLYSFCAKKQDGRNCIDGGEPVAGLTIDTAGNLYGTTSFGGEIGGIGAFGGTVFKLTPRAGTAGWMETVLYSFCTKGGTNCTDGKNPSAGLIMDNLGHLYGTTKFGGAHGLGTVFELP